MPRLGYALRMLPSSDEIQKVLDYDPQTGVFRWKIRTRNTDVGQCAGRVRSDGKYRIITLNGRKLYEHRLAWLFMTGKWPTAELEVEHRNRINTDNRWDNLRLATRPQNLANRLKAPSNGSSGYRGVTRRRGKWAAQIVHKGKHRWIGYSYATAEEAHQAWLAETRKLWGEFAP